MRASLRAYGAVRVASPVFVGDGARVAPSFGTKQNILRAAAQGSAVVLGRRLLTVPEPVTFVRAGAVDGVSGAGGGVVAAVYHVDGLHADVGDVKAAVASVVGERHVRA